MPLTTTDSQPKLYFPEPVCYKDLFFEGRFCGETNHPAVLFYNFCNEYVMGSANHGDKYVTGFASHRENKHSDDKNVTTDEKLTNFIKWRDIHF